MNWKQLTTLVLVFVLAQGADAGWFEKKKPVDTATRVTELINTLKNQPSASKRASAAEELRQFDVVAFPEIVSVLITALQKDSSSSVRSEAAQSLGRIKPTSAEVLQALEQALKQDDSAMVRWHSRTALWGYKLPAPPKEDKATVIKVPPPDASGRLAPVPVPGPGKVAHPKPLPPPPEDAKPDSETTVLKPGSSSEPGPMLLPNQATPTSLPRLAPPTKRTDSKDQGPILVPPPRS